ncbi:AAA family ATPase [Loktanella sp. F6476L]|uniref:AAA family ATPase n=1 Tax=Loktanella sp. F6476L TaxID=2926405 RepID=UPI001FF355EE|nr:AAA family ATPase [Loktanella sp. F6476L]MCK0120147.1 AAA family ATPase [Loktanella sp. F6476L]
MSSAVLQHEPQPIVACTVSRDVQIFDLLIEDMEAALGEQWGDLSFDDAIPFLAQPDAASLKFLTIAMDHEDEDRLALISQIIAGAKAQGIKVILITEDVSPAALHNLLREGGDEFVPYPLPESELARAIERVLTPKEVMDVDPVEGEAPRKKKIGGGKNGVIMPVHGLSGGIGATTMAVNLAWELATLEKVDAPKVCLLDFDFQFGTTATYLDLPRRETVVELLTDTESMDSESFMQAMTTYEDTLHVLTAPFDMIPLDLVGPEDIQRIMDLAASHFDYVVIDMPSTMVEWSQTVLDAAHVYFGMIELDMRSAQNTLRLKRALQAEDLPFEKIRFVLNRAPGFTDLNGKSRVKRLADSLGISIEVLMPDGGKPVAQNADHGLPLGAGLPKNALRKEIAKLAKSVHEVGAAEAVEG